MYLEVGQGPLLTAGGKVEATHDLGPYKALLISDPPSMGPVKYKFVLIVIRLDINRPVLYVTAEWNEVLKDLDWEAIRREVHACIDTLSSDGGEEGREEDEASVYGENETENGGTESKGQEAYFLGIFSLKGRCNLGKSRDWAIKEKFECKALEIAKEHLAIK